MADLLLDYRLENATVANPDGSLGATFTGSSVVSGPSATELGPFPKALDLGSAGKATVDLGPLQPDLRRFCVRVVFRAAGPVAGRQTLVQSSLVPFALYLSAESYSGDFNLVGAVAPTAHGWRGPDTRFKKRLKAGTWYTADLVYDTDTAMLFLDGVCLGVYAFPNGAIKKAGGRELFIGTGLDGESEHFGGSLAALQWYSGIPAEIEAAVGERRTNPEWYVTYKYESVRGKVDLGERIWKTDSFGDSHLQRHERGAIMYHDGIGSAFEMHGPIHDLYFSSRLLPVELGYLVSDEIDATQPGARKNLFSKGGIYWSPGTGAVPVSEEIYLEYEQLGESKAIGLPVRRAQATPGGREQEFQGARMYFQDGAATACEVHGAILDRFLATGGLGTWGYPICNELDVRKNGKSIGRLSRFEFCTFYWSGKTGAHSIHGDLRKKYEQLGGPRGALGFPTSDERDIPGVAGSARFNTFENGSLLWFGNFDSIVVATPFRVFVGRIDSKEEEGFGQGQNDIYCTVTLKEGGATLHSERWPKSGHDNGHNIVEPKITVPDVINPNDPAKSLTLVVDVWDYDDGGGGDDDHLGTWTQVLNMANGWGFRATNGLLDSGSFSNINSIKGSVKRDLDFTLLSETQKWWGVRNQDTKKISTAQYAKAFRDVDSDSEAWDLTDWLEKAFYELVIKGLAEHGNCFGMCLESIYARKDASVFGQPLDQFKNWADVRDEFNVKHAYQSGAATLWWWVGEVLSGNTGDPVGVFKRTRDAFALGDNPVVCLSRNRDYSGSPHVVLPVAWDDSSKPWTMTVLDPYFPGMTRKLSVDPDRNRFSYSGTKDYEGGSWTGGRFYFIPFSVLNERPRTPLWEAILLILAGTVVILGGDGQTERISDLRGRDLDGLGARATKQLRDGGGSGDFFVSFKGSGAKRPAAGSKGTVIGELLLRPGRLGDEPGGRTDLSEAGHRTIAELADDPRFRPLARELGRSKAVRRATAGRSVRHILADPEAAAVLPEPLREGLEQIVAASGPRDFVHTISGARNGKLHYIVKRGMSELEIYSTLQPDERAEVRVRAFGTSAGEIRLACERDKRVKLVLKSKLGIGRDFVSLTLDKVPVSTAEALQLNPKPGLAGLDLVGQIADRSVVVAVEGLVGGKKFNRQFTVPLGGGVSLTPSTVVAQSALAVSSITQLFGAATDGKLIKATA